jgi:hypothetical protein
VGKLGRLGLKEMEIYGKVGDKKDGWRKWYCREFEEIRRKIYCQSSCCKYECLLWTYSRKIKVKLKSLIEKPVVDVNSGFEFGYTIESLKAFGYIEKKIPNADQKKHNQHFKKFLWKTLD